MVTQAEERAPSRVRATFEIAVIVAIVLVIAHTLVQDFGDLFQWRWSARRALIYLGLGFDLFFSIEFVIRFMSSLVRKKPLRYLRDERGWIDFVASIPLLVFSSGPMAISAYNNVPTIATAAGVFGVLKVLKTIRIARVLRLLRVLKAFKHIKYTNSRMAQRHLTRIATTVVATVVVVLVGFSFLSVVLQIPNLEDQFEQYTFDSLTSRIGAGMTNDEIAVLTDLRPDVLIIKEGGQSIYSRAPDAYYEQYYGPSDYTLVPFPEYDMEVYIDLLPLVADSARNDILHFIIIIATILVILFLYGPHFATTISDPVQILSKGLKEKGHSLHALISRRYKDDEVFELADKYNQVFLPLKDRAESELQDGGVIDIDIDEVKKFIDG